MVVTRASCVRLSARPRKREREKITFTTSVIVALVWIRSHSASGRPVRPPFDIVFLARAPPGRSLVAPWTRNKLASPRLCAPSATNNSPACWLVFLPAAWSAGQKVSAHTHTHTRVAGADWPSAKSCAGRARARTGHASGQSSGRKRPTRLAADWQTCSLA